MPQFGAIGFGTPNRNSNGSTPSTGVGSAQILPSPSVWGTCDGSSMRDNPDGFFIHKDFKDDVTVPGLPNSNGTWTVPATGTDSAANLAYTSTGVAIAFTRPLLPVSAQSGNKLWGEVALNVQQSTAQTLFVGFATSTGLATGLLASSTTLISTAGLIGFFLHADVPTQFDAIYQKANGSPVTVLASTLSAAASNPDPANPLFVPNAAPGPITGNQGFYKLGVTVDRQYAKFFVNGTLVAKQTLDGTFDTTDSYGFIVAARTDTGNTDNVSFNFLRAAARLG